MKSLVLTAALSTERKNQNTSKCISFVSYEICVAGHIFARISIGVHKKKGSKYFKDVYTTQNTLRNET